MGTDTGQELESKVLVSPGLVLRPPSAGKERVVPVPPPPPTDRTHQLRFWIDSEQLQKSTQLRGSNHRTQACKPTGCWPQGKPGREFQHAQRHDKNLGWKCWSRPLRGHARDMTSWWDWRPDAAWRRDADGFNRQLAQWSYCEQQKQALNMVRTLPRYNGDEDVRMRWSEHVSKSNRPVHEAAQIKHALFRLQAQGYAISDARQVDAFDSELDRLNARGDNVSCGVQENGQLHKRRSLSDASTEYASRRLSTRSEEESLPSVPSGEEVADYWGSNKQAHQELAADMSAHALSFHSKAACYNNYNGVAHESCATEACVEHCSSLQCSAHARSHSPGLIPDESQYERRRRERRRLRHSRGGRDHRKEIVVESRDSRVVDALNSLRQLDDNIFRQCSKMRLLVGWLLGRVVSVVLSQLMHLGIGGESMKALQLQGTPVQWVAACLVAIWLGSMSVNWMGSDSDPSWQLGCLAAWVFTLIS